MLTGALFITGGIYLLRLANGRIQINPNSIKAKDWVSKNGTITKWSGYILLIWGAIRIIRAILFYFYPAP